MNNKSYLMYSEMGPKLFVLFIARWADCTEAIILLLPCMLSHNNINKSYSRSIIRNFQILRKNRKRENNKINLCILS